ncbi:MAG: hypothetical protein HFH68_00700 [Lachnospiraceae bacterium]|nr:hypothetical protein [Lachnospiraceae bacterium]
MKIKRVLQGTALTALAAAAWMGAGSADASASATATGITADANGNYVLNVTGTGKEVMVGVAKVSKSGVAKVASWDVYDGTSATVDLSKLNTTVDNYIAIKDNDEKVTFIGIAAASKKNTIAFNAATGKITEVKTKVGTTDGTAAEVQYRTATSNWSAATALSAIDLAKYQYQGATLYVRVPSSSTATVGTPSVKFEDTEYNVSPVGSLPSKETKLNIAKQANGPAVTLDYTKGTAKVKKGTEYRVVGSSIVSGAAVEANGSTLDVATVLAANDAEGVLEVRTAAKVDTNVKKCKVASKWTRVLIEKPKTFTEVAGVITTNTAATTGEALATVTTGGATAIKVEYTTKKVKNVETKNGVKLTNSSALAYQYFVGSAAPTADTAAKDIKTLKAKGTRDVVANIVTTGNTKIYIRVAGDKKAKRWVGQWAELVALPEIK